ncbi:patatin-like protein [Blastococcus sp. CT_GayMR20]|uniref:patatin-like protein n=1 Tax=Blastococcus sp. CT_GayMR20 TaxID=2559609 RepID=UPI001072F6EF|nr:patatin-like protein [Blastococcus sp. CT_GayMR20]
MTEPVTSAPSQPAPPVGQTTAARGSLTHEPVVVPPVRGELVAEVDHKPPDPRPRTLATQEVRLALAFTGGVSLAVWMGGVARELNLLAQASERRRTLSDAADPTTPDHDPLRRSYRRLLDLVDAEVAIDVLAGTSAGGINAALLGLANARNLDLGPLRDIWLTAGELGSLLRDPAEQSPPSLLKGDGRMLVALNEGITRLLGSTPSPAPPRATDVFITTTLLSPETSRFTDDYGTEIADTDHQGLFHFATGDLTSDGAVAQLSLAARSSASFPGAFEPAFLPFGADAGADGRHPDMAPFTNATCAHWAADGGLLANRPIAPLLQRIFDRSSDREVRRALLYIVPSTGASTAAGTDDLAVPMGLADALRLDLGAALNQSIAADLAAIKEHNDRIESVADTGLRMAALGNRLPSGEWLADAAAWRDYRARQGDWLVAPLVTEVARQLTTRGGQLPADWASAGEDRDVALRLAARDVVTKDWPTAPPAPEAVLEAAVSLGRPAYDSAKATLLRLLRHGRVLATTLDQRNFLAERGRYATRPLSDTGRSPLRSLVGGGLDDALQKGAVPPREFPELVTVVRALAREYADAQGDEQQLAEAWTSLAETYRRSAGLLRELVAACPAPTATEPRRQRRLPLRERRALVAADVGAYLDFLDDGDTVARFLDLHVAVRSVLPVLTQVAQPVELIQVSADTRSLLAPHHGTALTKLTGMQVHHFGAFYKPSWRANDWMWGRLDGCGWLVHVLLDPRRILSVLENDGVAPGSRAATFADLLGEAVERPVPPGFLGDLAFLDREDLRVPVSLPDLALWVAAVLQRHVVDEELPVVAGLVRAGQGDGGARRPRAPVDGRLTGTRRSSRSRKARSPRNPGGTGRSTASPSRSANVAAREPGATPSFSRTLRMRRGSRSTCTSQPQPSSRPHIQSLARQDGL